jgi:hypothetical protein
MIPPPPLAHPMLLGKSIGNGKDKSGKCERKKNKGERNMEN